MILTPMPTQSNVWLAIPSARPAAEVDPVMDKWRAQGYRIALYFDGERLPDNVPAADIQMFGLYEGYAKSCNRLVKNIIEHNADAEWFVCAGDDTYPDPNKTAQEIAAECSLHFRRKIDVTPFDSATVHMEAFGTFGVMQPTGDRWGANERWAMERFPDAPAYIDRICGSAWYGREFAERINGGNGLFWPEYFHCFGDEEMQNVAIKLGVLWQRRDLCHMHNHWGRTGDASKMPAFLAEANSPQHWAKYQALFNARKAAGFPGHEPK